MARVSPYDLSAIDMKRRRQVLNFGAQQAPEKASPYDLSAIARRRRHLKRGR